MIEQVNNINYEICQILSDIDGFEQSETMLEYHTNGSSDVIMFMGICIWDYDVDQREYLDDGITLEDLETFLKRRIKKISERLQKISTTL